MLITKRSAVCYSACLALIATLLSSCSGDHRAIAMGDHEFTVPEQHLSENIMPWSPRSRGEQGFGFFIDPEAALPNLIDVGVSLKGDRCHSLELAPSQLKKVCQAPLDDHGYKQSRLEAGIRKVPDPANKRWFYVSDDEMGHSFVLATCNKHEENRRIGQCQGMVPYEDLILTIYYNDGTHPDLNVIINSVELLLERWDVSPIS